MSRLILSVNSTISWLLKTFIFLTVPYSLFKQDYLSAVFAFTVLLISLIPAAVNRSYNTNLPWSLDFWLTLWIALSVLGRLGFYIHFPWWDSFLHLAGTAVLGYLAFVLVYALNFAGKIKLSIPLIGFSTFLIGVAFGALWEIGEFWVWRLTGSSVLSASNTFEDSLFDTFKDLQLDTLGALLIALFGMQYVAHKRHVKLRNWMQPFVKIFGAKIREKSARLKNRTLKIKNKIQQAKALKFSRKPKNPEV